MGAKSEFQRVLEKHLGPSSGPATQSDQIPQPNLQDSFLNQIKFSFTQFGRIKPSTAYPKKAAPPSKKIEVQLVEKVSVEKIREKRKLTFDQLKAIKVFSKYSMQSIDEYSTDEEIKTAYRRLAKTYHPDFNKNGAEQFKIISLAYNKLIK